MLPGDYADFNVVGKSVAVVAAVPGTVVSYGGTFLRDLGPGQRATLSGLVVLGNVAAQENGSS